MLNEQSGKKVNHKVIISNPISAMTAAVSGDTTKFINKSDAIILTPSSATVGDTLCDLYTDTIAYYITTDVPSISGTKVTTVKSKDFTIKKETDGTIKVTLNKDSISAKAYVYAITTDKNAKLAKAHLLLTINGDGTVQ